MHAVVSLAVLLVITAVGLSGVASSDFLWGMVAAYFPAIIILTWSDYRAYGGSQSS